LIGDQGRARVLQGGRVYEQERVVPDEDYPGYFTLGAGERRTGRLDGAFEHAVDQLVDVIDGVDPFPSCGAAEGRAAVATVEAIRGSFAEGGVDVEVS
jgi:hypothetical protein